MDIGLKTSLQVAALLTVDPKDRPSSREILDHTWFTNDEQLCAEAKAILFEVKVHDPVVKCVQKMISCFLTECWN